MLARIAPDVDVFRDGRSLFVSRRGRGFVRFPETPFSLAVMARLLAVPGFVGQEPEGAEAATHKAVTAALSDLGLLDWPLRSDIVPGPDELARSSFHYPDVARVMQVPIGQRAGQTAGEPSLLLVGSWADLALLGPATIPAGRPWAICRVRSSSVQVSTFVGQPDSIICKDCLIGRLLGHDDLLRTLWTHLCDGSCSRLTSGLSPPGQLIRLAQSALWAVAAFSRPGVLEVHLGQEPDVFHRILPYATCRHADGARPAAWMAPRTGRPNGLLRARARLEPVVGTLTGLIEPARAIKDAGLPIPVATARYADASGEGSNMTLLPDGSLAHDPFLRREAFGSGPTEEEAETLAALEGLERYCAIRQSHGVLFTDSNELTEFIIYGAPA